ncbi:MAG: metalloregulator ArsR/SmtB family transcription factor [Desulfobulbaceae bacterium]|nr:metalloregulator ArsR/SmtB family transcription factor [Desulfobulbaceae bacterium]
MERTPLTQTVAIARAFGNQARLRTVAMLREGELCVCQVTEVLKLAPSTVSAHLRQLRQAGVTTERKEGRWVYVALSYDPEIRPWLDSALAGLSGDGQTEADASLVEELRRLPVEDLCRLGYEAAKAKAGSNVAGEYDKKDPGGCE